jgi:hypothetical protein
MGRFTPPRDTAYLDQGYGRCVLCGDRLWPESFLVRYEGKLYCREHLAAKVPKEELDKVRFDFIGTDREEAADV